MHGEERPTPAGSSTGTPDPPSSPQPSDAVGPADASSVVVDAPGVEEAAVVAWPLMWRWRRRVTDRYAESDRYPWLVLAAALFGLFSVGFSITVLNIAIPEIARELNSDPDTLIWVITGPILLGAIFLPTAGKLADLYGARRVYLVSMVVVAVFAGLSAIAWNAGSLLAFRILGAAVGAATGPASVAVINRMFPRERRAQALGYWALVAAGGPVLGVVIGGPVVEFVSWRMIFVVQVPLTLLTVVICAVVFPDTDRVRSTHFDLAGAALLGVGTGALVLALNRVAADVSWANPVIVALLAACPVCVALFVRHERRIDHQLIPMRYFGRRNFSFPMVSMFFTNFAYMGGFFLTPFLLENVLGYSETKTGFLSIARPLTFAIAGPLAGWAATKVGERVNGVAGAAVITASMLVFAMIGAGATELMVIFALMLSGIGMGVTVPAMAAAVANAVDDRDLGVVGGAEQMIASIGIVVGTQLMMTVQDATGGLTGVANYAGGYLVGALAGVVGIVSASFVRRSAPAIAGPVALATSSASPAALVEAS